MPSDIILGIITVSDRAAAGEYVDLGGPALRTEAGKYGWTVTAETLRAFAAQGCGLILTTGGTGVAPRDVTPEAIRAIMRVELPGFGEAMRMQSLKTTPNAILSRALAAVVERALVIALPGKPAGAVECLGYVAGAVEHGVKLAAREPTSC